MASLVAEVQWVEIGIHFAEMCGPCNKWSVCGKQVKDVCTHMMLWVHTSVQDTAPRVLACNSSCLCSIINWSPQALLSFQPGWVLLACVTVNVMADFTLAMRWPSILPVCTLPFVTDLPSRRSFCVSLITAIINPSVWEWSCRLDQGYLCLSCWAWHLHGMLTFCICFLSSSWGVTLHELRVFMVDRIDLSLWPCVIQQFSKLLVVELHSMNVHIFILIPCSGWICLDKSFGKLVTRWLPRFSLCRFTWATVVNAGWWCWDCGYQQRWYSKRNYATQAGLSWDSFYLDFLMFSIANSSPGRLISLSCRKNTRQILKFAGCRSLLWNHHFSTCIIQYPYPHQV